MSKKFQKRHQDAKNQQKGNTATPPVPKKEENKEETTVFLYGKLRALNHENVPVILPAEKWAALISATPELPGVKDWPTVQEVICEHILGNEDLEVKQSAIARFQAQLEEAEKIENESLKELIKSQYSKIIQDLENTEAEVDTTAPTDLGKAIQELIDEKLVEFPGTGDEVASIILCYSVAHDELMRFTGESMREETYFDYTEENEDA